MTHEPTSVMDELEKLHEIVNRFGILRFKSGQMLSFDADDRAGHEVRQQAEAVFQEIDSKAMAIRTRVAALVEACGPFEFRTEDWHGDEDRVFLPTRSAGQCRALRAALLPFKGEK